MSRKPYKKEKKETFFQKLTNLVLTVLIACAISSQMCTAANNNLRFAQISDSHFSTFEENTSYKFLKKSPELLDDVIFQICTSGPYDFVIFTGDLVNKPKTNELVKFLAHASKINCPWYAINGNHDIAIDGPLTKDEFRKILNGHNKYMSNQKLYYAFTPKKGFRVICLDSIIDYKLTSNGEISQEQLKWLKNELDDHKKDVIVLCTHVPIDEPYSSSNHKLINEDEVKALCEKYDIDFKKTKQWYDGYRLDGFEIYNPYAIIELTKSKVFDSTWSNTVSNIKIINEIRQNCDGLREDLASLINGETLFFELPSNSSNALYNSDSKQAIFTSLIYLGYFCFNNNTIFIPNENARRGIIDIFDTVSLSKKQ